MILDDVQTWLEQSINFEKLPSNAKFSLDTMQSLVVKHDKPQNAFNCIHVAGSKGKGTVCQFLASILEHNNYSHGVYASPHIKSFAERVRTASGIFSDEVYQSAYNELQQNHTHDEATWFEFVTLFSFLSFKFASVEWAIFETGLGGRLDATNVIEPKICVITPIELEHTDVLGDTVEKIAAEKAGIFKQGVPVCSAKQSSQVRSVLQEKAKELNCPIYFVDDIFSEISYKINADSMYVELVPNAKNTLIDSTINFEQKMIGKVQAENAALAVLTIKVLELKNKIAAHNEAIIKGLSQSTLLGRFNIVQNTYDNSHKLRIILDGAHTKKSILNVLDTIFEQNVSSTNQPKIHLLFACAADKDVETIANLLVNHKVRFDSITLTVPGSFKQGNLKKTEEAFKSQIEQAQNGISCIPNLTVYKNYIEAIGQSIRSAAEKNADLLVTGSFYLVGEFYKFTS